ncbi:Wadjet anti-phage system protein JetD domain-containing protein [Saccharothrix sp. NRRL B-16314]|uniref:Wadjet anti-phage system protein JetD domain-containing protein n=1 Tax=Saccharothrix sp. NRRL B-16314 TaxID=1463825 RepID=UPI0018CC4BC1|nr:Wadjet anti-phage system protein JetD domain-containing protein [Saccharothrix sp. NRRL B-16314]
MPVPLPELPEGVAAYSVPRAKPTQVNGDTMRRDRKRRPNVTMADLLPEKQPQDFALPTAVERRDLVWFLQTGTSRRWSGMRTRLGDQAWDVTMEMVRAGVGILRLDVAGFDYSPVSFRLTDAWAAVADDYVAELTGRVDPDERRSELLGIMENEPDLAEERDLLARVPDGGPLRVPEGSRTRAALWSVYEAAIRAACVWLAGRRAGRRVTLKELAGFAFNDSKKFTLQQRIAFANLVNMEFSDAVDGTDVEILMRGPLIWHIDSVAADAGVAGPWIGLPANALHALGEVDTTSLEGILVIENKDTFQRVCEYPGITEHWLCVWGRGYASHALVDLLRALSPRRLAAWCDLDADGVSIVADLSRRLDRPITPVGMDRRFWEAGPWRLQTAEQLTRGRGRAAALAAEGPESLRDLASAIALNGEGREQETLYEEVLPELLEELRQIT